MALTDSEKAELRAYIADRTCDEWKAGERCKKRKDKTKMIGDKHEGCFNAERMLLLVDKA